MANNNEITKSVDIYINTHIYHYALMINGKWGCGKTYYVTKELIPHLRNNGKDVNYISLYGINSVDEIGQRLCIQSIKDKIGKKGDAFDSKFAQITSVILSAATKAGLSKISVDSSSVEELISKIPNYDNNVIVFDDLERCNCDINEVLGYINNFVEHSDASVIIVANEEEIGNCQYDRNPELQMLVALNTSLDVATDQTMDNYLERAIPGNQKQHKNNAFSVSQLEQRKNAIFHSNEKYKRIKEKVIGHTIEYKPDLEVIFPAIIKSKVLNQPVLHEALLSISVELIGIAESEQHFNLRTFQFFIEKAVAIFQIIDNKYSNLHKTVLLYTYNSAIRHMKGMEMPAWEGDYGNLAIDNRQYLINPVFGFKFVDELVYKDIAEPEYIDHVLSDYEKLIEKEGKLSNDPYQLINEWYLHSDEELKCWLEQMANSILEGKYSTALFTSIIKKIAQLYSYGIMVDSCDTVFEAMVNYIDNADPDNIDELEHEHFLPEGEDALQKYKEMTDKVSARIKEIKKDSEKHQYETAIEDIEKWGSNLLALASEEITNKKHTAIYWIEPEVLIQKIEYSSNFELQQFRYTLSNYYNGYIYYENKRDDKNNLRKLLELLKKQDRSLYGQIKSNYYSWIINDINRYLELISQEQECISAQ